MRRHSSPAFTLIELLVVIGLIAFLAAGFGLALSGGGDKSAALQNGQYTINSLLSGARAKAALSQQNARLFVNATPGTENFLREFRIAIPDPSNPAKWVASGDPVLLPKGIALVPKSGAFLASEVDLAPEAGGAWPANYSSDAIATSSGNTTLELSSGTDITGVTYREVQTLNPRGTTSNSAGIQQRVVLGPVEVIASGSGTLLRFKKPEFVRGLRISTYGIASLINDATGFD